MVPVCKIGSTAAEMVGQRKEGVCQLQGGSTWLRLLLAVESLDIILYEHSFHIYSFKAGNGGQ